MSGNRVHSWCTLFPLMLETPFGMPQNLKIGQENLSYTLKNFLIKFSGIPFLKVEIKEPELESFYEGGMKELVIDAETEDDENHAFFIQKW